MIKDKVVFYDDEFFLEINTIGYKKTGECIVFFLKKSNDKVIYAGLVDCYEENGINMAIQLLRKGNKRFYDFVCWTHPHEDHTKGLDLILENYCNKDTIFWMSDISFKDVKLYCEPARDTCKHIFREIESPKRYKMKIKKAKDHTKLATVYCIEESGGDYQKRYCLQISSFAPDSELIAKDEMKDITKRRKNKKNKNDRDYSNRYSMGLTIDIGNYCFILAGDVENTTLKKIEDRTYFDNQPNYIKVPHHTSGSSDYLIDVLKQCNYDAPQVTTSTVYYKNNLPDEEVIKKYREWGPNTDIYITGNIEDEDNNEEIGMVTTTADILQKREYEIETKIYGNAIYYNDFE